MSTDCTITRLVRCRVKDLASCFYACRFPLEEEAASSGSRVPTQPILNPEATLEKKMCNENGKSVQSSSSQNNSSKNGDDSSWPSFVEEDYIVFCFREDGAIEMINDSKSSSESFHQNILKRKLRYSSNRDSRKEGMVDSEEKDNQTNEEEIDILDPKVEEIKEMNINNNNPIIEETSAHTFESCDSSLSDNTSSSTSSFAFPVLGIEWMGSPVQMPRSDKHKNRIAHLYCCRF
ncbi:hypothetical protein ACJIZ3_020738 [Penstemon smallii]|uniref:Uncharacterized protein n=1 Tax=Penstemon smallii TaxID=265156 RepID=A0ABD3SJH2_9LAMI